jgi:hypothetical protein
MPTVVTSVWQQSASSVQLHTLSQALGQATQGQLNALRQGVGGYWDPNNTGTSSQQNKLSYFRGVNIYNVTGGNTAGGVTSIASVPGGNTSIWVQGTYYAADSLGAINVQNATQAQFVNIRNDAVLYGYGGGGGWSQRGVIQAGFTGGAAVIVGAGQVSMYNNGTIYGGGGGGGAGGAVTNGTFYGWGQGGSGGGGASFGSGGNFNIGQPGTGTTGGNGSAGTQFASQGGGSSGAGGKGGNPGQNGATGATATAGTIYRFVKAPGAGGTAGPSVSGHQTLAWTVAGTHN